MRPILLFIILFVLTISTLQAQQKKFRFYSEKMGSPFMVIIGEKIGQIDSVRAVSLFEQSIHLVDSLNHILSDYDSTSDISIINKNAGKYPTTMHLIIEEILLIGKIAYHQTNGLYNLAIGPLSQLWRHARKSKKFPETWQVKEAVSKIAFDRIKIDSIHHKVLLSQKGMLLDFGSLGKGYVAQQVIGFLKRNGADYALVDAGGKIATCAPDSLHWEVGINQIRDFNKTIPINIQMHNQAVATSGDLYQFFIHNGRRYSHIIHPKTGYGIETPKNVTVIARDGVTADWLSTACSLLSIKEAFRLAAMYQAEVYIAMEKQGAIVSYQSKGWKEYLH